MINQTILNALNVDMSVAEVDQTPGLVPLPRFSLAERDRRWKAVREAMAEQGIDAIVSPQNSGHSTDFQASTRWLTYCGGGGDADIAAVFPIDDDVTAIATSADPRWTTTQKLGSRCT